MRRAVRHLLLLGESGQLLSALDQRTEVLRGQVPHPGHARLSCNQPSQGRLLNTTNLLSTGLLNYLLNDTSLLNTGLLNDTSLLKTD
eukprot:1175784-Prorocentrum_minimum.AAC.1